MIPVPATDAQVAEWAAEDGCPQVARVIGGPAEGPDVIPCPTLVAADAGVVHVAYQLDENDLRLLSTGGTLWLTSFGGLPIHRIEVR